MRLPRVSEPGSLALQGKYHNKSYIFQVSLDQILNLGIEMYEWGQKKFPRKNQRIRGN